MTEVLRSQEDKWKEEGKTNVQIRRLRYYYRHKKKILKANRSPEVLRSLREW